MIVTKIAKMGSEDKFAVFVDDTLRIILSGQSILNLGVTVGMDLSVSDIEKFNSHSTDEKLYNRALKYINLRLRSEGEVRTYLKRKEASPKQINTIVARLIDLGLINDKYYVQAYIHDKLMVKPASKRKITYELRKKQISEQVIKTSLDNGQVDDKENLKKTIELKRNQSKYQDDLKLMQYLVRLGYNYSDVKQALHSNKD